MCIGEEASRMLTLQSQIYIDFFFIYKQLLLLLLFFYCWYFNYYYDDYHGFHLFFCCFGVLLLLLSPFHLNGFGLNSLGKVRSRYAWALSCAALSSFCFNSFSTLYKSSRQVVWKRSRRCRLLLFDQIYMFVLSVCTLILTAEMM